jgi:hypothetical protein
MRQALTRMLMGFIMALAGLIIINLIATKMAGAQEHHGYYDWTHSHFNRGDRGWASSAFQEQHGPRVKGQPRYRPGGDRPYRHYRRPRTVITDEVIRPDHGHHHGHSRHYYADPRHEHHRKEKPGTTRRDATGDVQCWPFVEAYSTEANTEDGAWKDAQRNWENVVRSMYGERFMEIGNAKDGGERQCWVSSGNQSVAGRAMERLGDAVQRVTGNEQGVDGRKHRCRVMLRPCMAPRDYNPTTKADKQ